MESWPLSVGCGFCACRQHAGNSRPSRQAMRNGNRTFMISTVTSSFSLCGKSRNKKRDWEMPARFLAVPAQASWLLCICLAVYSRPDACMPVGRSVIESLQIQFGVRAESPFLKPVLSVFCTVHLPSITRNNSRSRYGAGTEKVGLK